MVIEDVTIGGHRLSGYGVWTLGTLPLNVAKAVSCVRLNIESDLGTIALIVSARVSGIRSHNANGGERSSALRSTPAYSADNERRRI